MKFEEKHKLQPHVTEKLILQTLTIVPHNQQQLKILHYCLENIIVLHYCLQNIIV